MPGSIQPTVHRALQIVVILLATGLVYVNWMKADRDSNMIESELTYDSEVERNERSTPRSFILPATPGVAFEQEAQKEGAARQAQIAKCVGTLRLLGYEPGDSRTVLNAKLVEAVYTYQLAHKLPTTGRLDELTIKMLKCELHENTMAS